MNSNPFTHFYCGPSPVQNRPFIVEEWKTVTQEVVPFVLPNAYQVSTFGRVWSNKQQKIMAITKGARGYNQCMLYGTHSKTICVRVDRLVMKTFAPVPNMDELQVNHRDTDITKDFLYNLEWCDGKTNTMYADLNKSRLKSETIDRDTYLIPKEVLENVAQDIRAKQISQTKIAKKYNISIDVVEGISMGTLHKDLYDKYNLSEVKGMRPHVSEISEQQIEMMCVYLTNNFYDKNIHKTKRNYFISAFNAVGCYKDSTNFTDSNNNFVRKIIYQQIYKSITMKYDFSETIRRLNL